MEAVEIKVGAALAAIALIFALGLFFGLHINNSKLLNAQLRSTQDALKSTQDALVEQDHVATAKQGVIDEYHRTQAARNPVVDRLGGVFVSTVGICPDMPATPAIAGGRADPAAGPGEDGGIGAARERVRESAERLRAATQAVLDACRADDDQLTYAIKLSDAIALTK